MLASFDQPTLVHGSPTSLEEVVMQLLPTTGSVEVQRDTPGREHPTHTHPTPETLHIVSGTITFRWGENEAAGSPGDRLLLPAQTPHSSIAGEQGCLYVIATRFVEF